MNRREKVLLVQRTGWGKSAVYFISATMLRHQGVGVTVIVSPLVGLMRNQVRAGQRIGLRIGALHAETNDRFDTFRLRQAGSGPVFPFALASTKPGDT